MTDSIHSCSYECQRPACVLRQRDELVGEIERLRAELARLERECDARDTTIRILDEERDKLRAELAEAKRGAERYRWLRGDSCADHSVRWTQWEVRCWEAPRWTDDLRRDALDAAIDRARGAE